MPIVQNITVKQKRYCSAYGMTEAGSISMSRNVRETMASVGYITPTVELKVAIKIHIHVLCIDIHFHYR